MFSSDQAVSGTVVGSLLPQLVLHSLSLSSRDQNVKGGLIGLMTIHLLRQPNSWQHSIHTHHGVVEHNVYWHVIYLLVYKAVPNVPQCHSDGFGMVQFQSSEWLAFTNI
jgi:hypothetical protein